MMNDFIVSVEKSTRMVDLPKNVIGNDMENLQEKLIFKFTDEFVKGQGRLEYKIGSTKNYIVLSKENDTYTMPLKNVLTKEGKIEMQLVITENEVDEEIPVFKSNVFYLYCNKSINAVNEAPDGYELWIETANAKLNLIDEALTEVDNLDIDVNKVGTTTTVELTKKDGTTESVQILDGQKGQDGITPTIGQNGNWFLGETDTGKPSRGIQGEKGQDGENGTDGHDGVDGQDGQDGHTPVKYVDYWTTQDKQEIVTDVETDLQPTITAIQNTANTAVSLAKLANQAKSYPTYQAFINYLNTAEKTEFIPGQSFMIQTKLIPDLWVYSVENTSVQYTYTTDEDFITYTNQATGGQVGYYKLAQLETQKVDLTNYYTNTQTDTLLGAKVDKSSFVYDSNTETLSITMI